MTVGHSLPKMPRMPWMPRMSRMPADARRCPGCLGCPTGIRQDMTLNLHLRAFACICLYVFAFICLHFSRFPFIPRLSSQSLFRAANFMTRHLEFLQNPPHHHWRLRQWQRVAQQRQNVPRPPATGAAGAVPRRRKGGIAYFCLHLLVFAFICLYLLAFACIYLHLLAFPCVSLSLFAFTCICYYLLVFVCIFCI